MHMSDPLVSPVIGAFFHTLSLSTIFYSIYKIKKDMLIQNDNLNTKIAFAGVLGALVFVTQMINFSIPNTGSSGHFAGGLLLSLLLGSHMSFLTMSVILALQAFLFADGGILALGANIFNLGFIPSFIIYPIIVNLINNNSSKVKIYSITVAMAILGLQLGAFGVVVETMLSKITSLTFMSFLSFMQPIHLAIGIVEGIVTASIVYYVAKSSSQVLVFNNNKIYLKKPIYILASISLIIGGLISHFASENPDGLEWSINKMGAENNLLAQNIIHNFFANIQHKLSILPDYNFVENISVLGTSLSGIVGAILVFSIIMSISFLLRPKLLKTI